VARVPDEMPPYAVGQLLRRAHTRAARAFAEALAPLGIEGRHFGVLAVVAEHGPQTQRDLVERVGSDRVSMMRIVDDLEARALATRRPVPGDRRLRAVELTDRGRRSSAPPRTSPARPVGRCSPISTQPSGLR
jgi:MarR family transcriptional regulator, lower aerobic nicotinate degradation pathway regulator